MKIKATIVLTFDTEDYVEGLDTVEQQETLVRDMLTGGADLPTIESIVVEPITITTTI